MDREPGGENQPFPLDPPPPPPTPPPPMDYGSSYPRYPYEPMFTRLSVGYVLGNSFVMFFGNFINFTLIGLIVFIPFIVWGVLIMTMDFGSSEDIIEQIRYYNWAEILYNLLVQPIATGAIIYGVFRKLQKKRVSLGKCLAVGMSRFMPLAGIAVLSLLMYLGILALPVLLTVGIIYGGGGAFGILLILGALVPVVILACALYAAAPACVVEKHGVIASIKRSFQLTRGNRGRIFAVTLVLGITMAVMSGMLNVIVMLPALSDLREGSDLALVGSEKMSIVVDLLTTVVQNGLMSSAAALAYYRMKVQSEGADEQELAAVFD